MTDLDRDTGSGSDVPGEAPMDEGKSLLEGVDGPEDVKALDGSDLLQLCDEVRGFLLDSVQRTGGHLGSNLGVVELTVALHRIFDFKRDRLVWDVSHQAYPHKVLTGRKDRFDTLRRTDGLCGFTHPEESPYDLFHTGHAGTSVSLGLGLATGMAHEEDPPHVVSVIGDASLGAGVAFEALNHAGATRQKLLVVLNDNEWSISKSVGSLSKYLTKLRGSRLVQRAGQETKSLVQAIPLIGPRVDKALDDVGEVLRHVFVPGHVFEELGVRYVGPVDGHDVKGLVDVLARVRELDGVVLLHVLTEKGKGHPDGPNHPERVHAVKASPKVPQKVPQKLAGKFDPQADGAPKPAEPVAPKPVAFTKAFASSLVDHAARDVRVHAITAAMPSGTGLDAFADQHPSRFHDAGICEQHAVAMAAGMAKAGMRPVTAIYSTFLQRGYDQVFQEVALQNLPVVFALDRAGPVGQDGPTHNGVFDIAYLRTFPNMVLAAPRDATDVDRMLGLALRHDGPTALRFPRGNCPVREEIPEAEREEMRVGRAEVLRDGDDGAVLWAYGSMVGTALEVSARLAARGVEIGVVDARFAKPLDETLLGKHLRRYRHVLTLEDHQRAGGFGSAVLEAAARIPVEGRAAHVRVLGLPDRFVDHMTTREEQLASVGLDAAGVERTIAQLLGTVPV
ncbi:MAG: 1-deoxy-D-xylulose-5-phosphate synthase [Planctomycetota bacterium]